VNDLVHMTLFDKRVPAMCWDCKQLLRYRERTDTFTCGCPDRERSMLVFHADQYKFMPPSPPRPPQIPGYVWTGEYYERIATPEPRRALPEYMRKAPLRIPPIVWWVIGALIILWLVCS